ncbi:hypothetical protein QWT87_03620 [Chryseobacterium sp. APV1]|uniref:Uncharacterized protein n=1 Tax=Chryseobacterium urinae TaxID=3058400 RepID=A0ABT8U0K1_9FLAO|nr:hypothetical protein [Chryseobacterium sp. APV1]MDO3423966.1 hypothetical protein [Chryseobacterium sp. APV1]
MKKHTILLLCFVFTNAFCQLDEQKLFPRLNYEDETLGSKLKIQFGKHTVSCNVIRKQDSDRDYISSDIKNFLRVNLSTIKVSSMSINGSSLFRYIFFEDELKLNMDASKLNFETNKFINKISDTKDGFNLVDENTFPSYVYTTNCSKFLNIVSKGNVKYAGAALSAAIDADVERKFGLYLYEGVFKSPLSNILSVKNNQTTELMLNLWDFYKKYPEYNNKAYYLESFQGLTVGRFTSSEQYKKIESDLGINISAQVASVETNMKNSFDASSTFRGTDFETFVYKDGKILKTNYVKLPNLDDIISYFQISSLTDIKFNISDQLMSDGNNFEFYIDIDGFSQSFISPHFWEINVVDKSSFEDNSVILSKIERIPNSKNSVRFTLSGIPNKIHFSGKTVSDKIPINLEIKTRDNINNKKIILPVKRDFSTTVHPIPNPPKKAISYTAQKSDNDKYELNWVVPINFEDSEKPVLYQKDKIAEVKQAEFTVGNEKISAEIKFIGTDKKTYELHIKVPEISSSSNSIMGKNILAKIYGVLKIPLQSGGYALKPVTATLEYPDKIIPLGQSL